MAFVLQLFGGFRLIGEDGKPVSLPDRARALLAYLAVASSPVPRQALAELLSSDGNEQEQRTALRQAVYLTRKALVDSAVICAQENDLVLNDALVSADVRLFLIACSDDRRLAEAVELYRGPFLDGERSPSSAFEEWLGARRAEFLEHALEALLKLAGSDAAAGLHSSALAHARRALTLDPLREDAHRQVMRSLAALGQRSNSLRQYEIAQQMLAEELGVSPESETEALREAIAHGDELPGIAEPMSVSIATDDMRVRARFPALLGRMRGRRTAIAALMVMLLIIVGGAAVWNSYPRLQPSSSLPSIAVLPFANMSGDPAQDYLEYGILEEISTMLSTHPSIRVASRTANFTHEETVNAQQLGREMGAQYLLGGSVRKSAGKIHITAQLIDADTGYHLWARQFEQQGDDLVAIQEEVANGIYESLVGFTGEIERQEQRRAWSKSAASLEEQDYVLRGEQFYFRFTKEGHARARQIWQDGLAKFPDSARLRIGLAGSYRHGVEAGWSEHPEQDLDRAWQLAGEAALTAHNTQFDQWLSHWVMAKLAQWCKGDYERSIAEAEAAIKLVPYDATSRADLAELMANAGRTSDAIEWLQEAIRRDPNGPEWYRANLAWAYYLASRHGDALAELQKLSKQRRLLLAVLNTRLGHVEDARVALTDFLKENPDHTLVDEARRPLIGSLKQAWLDDLREAGLPER